MTRQEAVKWLSNLKMDIGKTQHQELWHYEQALDEIMQALKQEQAWIPVSERLPEIGKVVLITCPFTICLSEHGNKLVTFDQWNGKEWIRFDGYVSAWQPLPEPYEEAEQ